MAESSYSNGVFKPYHGNGKCLHKLLDESCPYCGNKMVEVVTTGFRFCSSHESVCDYEDDTHTHNNF